ncbi:transmembrane protein 165, partial [Danaus plexippus plexippus]
MNVTDFTTDFSSYSSDYDSVYYDSTTVLYDSTVGDVTTVSSETEDFRGWLMSVVMK